MTFTRPAWPKFAALIIACPGCLSGVAAILGASPAHGQVYAHEETVPSAGSEAASARAPVSNRAPSVSIKGWVPPEPPLPGAPTLLSVIEGVNFDADRSNSGVFHIPPDPHGAAGPAHVVSVTNTSIFFSTKDGVTASSQSLASFFAPQSPTTNTFDPKVIYDQYEGRFVVVTLEREEVSEAANAGNISRIFVAVSATSDPTGTWRFLTINSKIATDGFEHWADYPGFAIDGQAVYITTNLFRFVTGVFGGYRLWVIDKGAPGGFYAGSAAAVTLHDPAAAAIAGGGSGFELTTMPAHIFGAPPAGVGTFLVQYSGITDFGTDFVAVIRVDNPLGSIAFSEQLVDGGNFDSQAAFGGGPQSGTSVAVETNDRILLQAVWRDDNLYAVTTVTPPSGADAGHETAHWFRMDTSTLSAITMADQGDIGGEDIATGARTFFPSIAVNSVGDMAVGFALTASTLFPGAYYTSRLAGDAAGTVDPTSTLAAGVAFYVRTFGGPQNRWGDYSGMSVDPADDRSFWVFNEYAMSQGTDLGQGELGRWATRFGKFSTFNADLVYVDFGYSGAETGASSTPFDTLAEALAIVNADGTIRINGNSAVVVSNETFTGASAIGQSVTIEANPAGSGVKIGVVAKGFLKIDPGGSLVATEDGTTAALEGHETVAARIAGMLIEAFGDSAGEIGIQDGTVHAKALPYTRDGAGARIAGPDTPLAIRMRSGADIDSTSIWGAPEGTRVEVRPGPDGSLRDIWVVVAPNDDRYFEGVIALTLGASTVLGGAVESATQSFRTDSDAEAAEVPGLPSIGLDVPHFIEPEEAYATPQRIWLPLPAGVNADEVQLYYYHAEEDQMGWYPAERVEGWLVPGSYQIAFGGGITYFGFLVRHAAIVQLGVPAPDAP